ncbi:MAG TPA: hypothetical protein VN200_07010 [Rhodoglobus sp.]|nr:hypothetical protein [Rhodoglobus sp.]
MNTTAFEHAEKLIKSGKVVHDERDDWSEHAKSTDAENRRLDQHGWDDYAKWHLGEDKQATEETKGRFSFPFGDFTKVHRCAVISLESRAAQYDHDDIAKAAKRLLNLIDGEG